MLSENTIFLKKNHSHIQELLQTYENKDVSTIVVDSKNGIPTIKVLRNGITQFLHSTYDPRKEAERLIDGYDEQEISKYEHVLFYGAGFGYHIEVFMKRYPHFTFSIYEPGIEIFNQFINRRKITDLPVLRLKDIFIEINDSDGRAFLEQLSQNIQERILLIVLPSYESLYKNEFKDFVENFKEAINSKRQSLYVDVSFSSRWTLNSLLNFPTTLKTPNILNGFNGVFKGKPLLIVSAGPSLEEEYINLKYIKDNKLAYIFAVGSANRALIANDILPDAVCTYDPQFHNYAVFSSILDKGINTVPMIFGTSVGFETIKLYPGPKIHMVTSQDTVSSEYLKTTTGQHIDIVNDSPTIAAITFQVAAKLGCYPIVLVGQNLAYRNSQYYSKQVDYKNNNRPVYIEEKEKEYLLFVKDVYGNEVETNPSLNNMRENIEWQIKQFQDVEVVNTTKGGAAINGTTFEPLEDLINKRFKKSVVDEKWYAKSNSCYDIEYTIGQAKKMERSILEFQKYYNEINSVFYNIEKNLKYNKSTKIAQNIIKFDKLMKKIVNNGFYNCYIAPVNRTHFQALSICAANIRKHSDDISRAKLILDAFPDYIERCNLVAEKLRPALSKVHENIYHLNSMESTKYKTYPCDSGVFTFYGEWTRINFGPGKTIDFRVHQFMAKNIDDSLCFKFTGQSLRLFGANTKKLKISIDGKEEIISTFIKKSSSSEVGYLNELIYEVDNLRDKEHFVEIKLLENQFFLFSGIEIDIGKRVYHINEVCTINDIKKGTRIRCHYSATNNRVGEFSAFGKETNAFLPITSCSRPDGDFYFICVDVKDGQTLLIADRNIQNLISWDVLYDFNIATEEGYKVHINNCKDLVMRVKLLSGGTTPDDYYNDWNRYIVNTDLCPNIESYIENIWNAKLQWSWTYSKENIKVNNKDKGIIRGGASIIPEFQYINRFEEIASSVTDICGGFRPMIFVEKVIVM